MRGLIKRGWVVVEEEQRERDPLRAAAERLEVEFLRRPAHGEIKLKKSERELLAFLELHPGPHNLAELAREAEKCERGRPGVGAAGTDQARGGRIDGRPAGYERPVPQSERVSERSGAAQSKCSRSRRISRPFCCRA